MLVMMYLKMTDEDADVDNQKLKPNKGLAVFLLELYPWTVPPTEFDGFHAA